MTQNNVNGAVGYTNIQTQLLPNISVWIKTTTSYNNLTHYEEIEAPGCRPEPISDQIKAPAVPQWNVGFWKHNSQGI